MGGYKRLAASLAVSIAVHCGLGASIATDSAIQEKPKAELADKVKHEPIATGKTDEAARLRKERKEYVAELFSALRKGDSIRLSPFLIKSETLDANIERAEGGFARLNESTMRMRYLQIADEARTAVIGQSDTTRAVHQFMHKNVLHGYFWESGSVVDVLEKGWYNCASSTKLFTALLEDVLGEKEAKILIFKEHLASYIRGSRIDAVDGNWDKASRAYDGCGQVAPSRVFVAAYLVRNGVPVGDLPHDIASLYTDRRQWRGCPAKGKENPDLGPGNSGLPSPDVLSGLSVPKEYMPNRTYKQSQEEITTMGKAMLAAYRLSHLEDDSEYLETKMEDGKLFLNPIMIPAGADWGTLMRTFYTSFHLSLVTDPKSMVSCCDPMRSIPPRMLPEIIAHLSSAGDHRFDRYTPPNICQRYKKAAEKGSDDELDDYNGYDFCPGMESTLEERYTCSHNRYLLGFYSRTLRSKEEQDLFMKGLDSADTGLKINAAINLLNSDRELACKTLRAMPEPKLDTAEFGLMYGCRDQSLAWNRVESAIAGNDQALFGWSTALEILDGKTLSAERYERLKQNIDRIPFPFGPDLARVFYEHGDKEFGKQLMHEVIEKHKRTDVDAEGFINLCGLPQEFNPIVVPLLSENRYVHRVAQNLVCNGGYKDYLPGMTAALRRVVADSDSTIPRRVRAAFILLRLNIDPLGKD